MQVNNVQSPNFGMALKIDKGAQKLLQETPISTLKKLNRVGKNIKDTKYFHIRVDENGCHIHSEGDAPFGAFNLGEYKARPTWHTKESLIIEKNNKEIAKVIKTYPYAQSLPNYHTTNKSGTILKSINKSEELANIVKILDNAAIAKYAKATEPVKTITNEPVNKYVDKLMKTYGK